MPVVIVHGMPDNTPGLEDLIGRIQSGIASIPELELQASEISVFFPRDLVQLGLGEEVIVSIERLFEKPERTLKIRQRLALSVASVIEDFALAHLPQCKLVEIFVNTFNPETEGFSIARKNPLH